MQAIVRVLCRLEDRGTTGTGDDRFMNRLFDIRGQWAGNYEKEMRTLDNKDEKRI